MNRNNSVGADLDALKEKCEKLSALSKDFIRCKAELEQRMEQLAAYDGDEVRQLMAVIAEDLQLAEAFSFPVKMVLDGLTKAIRIYAEADDKAFGIVKSLELN